MHLELHYILQLLHIDFFIAFGEFTILYFLLSIFIKKPILKKIDIASTEFISFIGITYLIVWITNLMIQLNTATETERTELLNWMFGKYWFGCWIQPLLWFAITQLFRFKFIRQNVFLRIIFTVLLMISIERLIIIITAFHRDYLPSTWTMYTDLGIYPSNIFLAIILKILIFLAFVGLFQLIKNKWKVVMSKVVKS